MSSQTQSYLGNPNVKRDGVQQAWTPDLLKEYKKCMTDPIYFARHYVKVIALDKGLVNFDLYPYQEQMFKHFDNFPFWVFIGSQIFGFPDSRISYF